MRLTKIFLVIVTALSLVSLGYFIYVSFFKPAPTPTTQAPSITKQLKAVGTPKKKNLVVLTKQSASAYWTATTTNTLYYVANDGRVLKTFGDGREEEVSSQTLPNFYAATSNASGALALGTFSYPISPVFAMFSTDTNAWERLPAGTIAAAFSPDGNAIAYIQDGPRQGSGSDATGLSGTLSVLQVGDKKSRVIGRITIADGTLQWPKSNTMYITTRPSSEISAEVWELRLLNNKKGAPLAPKDIASFTIQRVDVDTRTTMVLHGNIADVGLQLISKDAATSELYLTNRAGVTLTKLPFLTLPSKCTFDDVVLYCALPNTFPTRARLPEDYSQERFYTADALISYDTTTGSARVLYESGAVIDAEQLTVRDGGSTSLTTSKELLFRNRYDGKLYSLQLD